MLTEIPKYCWTVIVAISENIYVKTIIAGLLVAFKFLFDINQIVPMGSIVVLVVFDFITGILAAIKTGEHIESSKVFRSAIKLFVYSMLVSASFLTGTNLIGFPGLDQLMMAFIAATELISILENTGKMGYVIPQRLLNQLKTFRDES